LEQQEGGFLLIPGRDDLRGFCLFFVLKNILSDCRQKNPLVTRLPASIAE
jgi:hypothetical protein